MPDVATNTEARFVDDTVGLLQTSNRRLTQRVSELESRQSAQTVIEHIIGVIEDQWDTHLKTCWATDSTPIPLVDQFYVCNEDGSHASIDPVINYKIESLWLGRLKKARMVHEGQLKTLTLHPSRLQNDRPLPMFLNANGSIQGIIMRQTLRTHSFIVKHDPLMPGTVFGTAQAKEWLAMPNIMSSATTSCWSHHAGLERLTSMFLGRAPRLPSLATLVVDSTQVRQFLEIMQQNDQARCHFTCSGQTTMHAYLFLTRCDAEQSEIGRMSIGSIL